MKKQKIQMLVVVILLVICVVAYIFISKNAGKLDSTENDGPNASMGNKHSQGIQRPPRLST